MEETGMFSQPQTLPCPNCKEIINDTMSKCPYCEAPIDHEAALAAAAIQEKVNKACSDASFVRTAAALMFILLALSLLPFISGITYVGSIITFFVVLVLIIRWQVNFGGLKTDDKDFSRARRLRNISAILWVIAIPAFLVRDIISHVINRIIFR